MRTGLLLAALLALSGCSHISYYAQAIGGQMEIVHKAEPIADVLADPATPTRVAEKLRLVQQARAFASQVLALPDNSTFQNYANLQRPYVVWNVFAAPELSVTPVVHCFPVAGCVAYRGYFSEAAAREESARLRAEGLDVFVGGIPVYSTLGWFNDPVLNTFLGYDEGELVGVIFHELAHQVVYVPGDTVFNESFATAVEEEGVRRWFAQSGRDREFAGYQETESRKQDFIQMLVRTRDRLSHAYAQPLDALAMREAKANILSQAKTDYARMKQSWGGDERFDQWFKHGGLNNAKLAAVALYADRVPAFKALLAQAAGDWPRFYERVGELAQMGKDERALVLNEVEGMKVAATSKPGDHAQ